MIRRWNKMTLHGITRHCERNEAIRRSTSRPWIASALRASQ